MAATVKVVGEAELAATMDAAIRELPDLDTTEAAHVVASAAAGSAPRLTGRLAGSITGSFQDKRGTITSPVVYAVPIHWGRPAHGIVANPFVSRAWDRSESAVVSALQRSGQKLCDTVRGA